MRVQITTVSCKNNISEERIKEVQVAKSKSENKKASPVQDEHALTNPCGNISQEILKKKACQQLKTSPVQGELALTATW
jgi:hypothetical protein